jgi:hypothetical protein
MEEGRKVRRWRRREGGRERERRGGKEGGRRWEVVGWNRR